VPAPAAAASRWRAAASVGTRCDAAGGHASGPQLERSPSFPRAAAPSATATLWLSTAALARPLAALPPVQGPSLLLFPDTYRDAFAKLGTRLEDHVDITRVEPAAYRVFFGSPSSGAGMPSSASASGSTSGGDRGTGGQSASSGSSSDGSGLAGGAHPETGGSTSNGETSSGQSPGGGCSHMDLMYDVQRMAQQLEELEQGGAPPPSLFPRPNSCLRNWWRAHAWDAPAAPACRLCCWSRWRGPRAQPWRAPHMTSTHCLRPPLPAPKGAGTEFIAWLADARRALVVGTENFIARDAEGFADLLDPSRLLPLLGKVNMLELLGQHHGRWGGEWGPGTQAREGCDGLTPNSCPPGGCRPQRSFQAPAHRSARLCAPPLRAAAAAPPADPPSAGWRGGSRTRGYAPCCPSRTFT
jgi:hypothetical protein